MKIMIVDDEPVILAGIENMILNEFGKKMDIIKAFDGIDALEKLEHITVDLIITDICMPEMSGLELIERILQNGSCSRFIILTGYADFEYARQALQYKAIDYILKPIDKEKLVEHINKLSESISQEQDRLKKRELGMVKEILLYDSPYEEFFLDGDTLKRMFPFSLFRVLLIQAEDSRRESNIRNLEALLRNLFDKHYLFSRYYKNQHVILVNYKSNICERIIYDELMLFKEERGSNIKGFAISKPGDKIDSIHMLYNEALRQLYLFKYSSVGGLSELTDFRKAVSLPDYREIAEIFESGKKEERLARIRAYLEKLLAVNRKSPNNMRNIYAIILSDIEIYLQDLGLSPDAIPGLGSQLGSMSGPFADETQLLDQVSKLMEEVSKHFIKKDLKSRYSESVSKMLDFINSNYMKDISLDAMSETVDLHPNYASSLFKKEIGTSFIQYLNTYRIIKAKAFIKRNSDFSLEKIAVMVGYENPGHFIKVFKKYCNITPGEFRHQLST